jgi:hypothetical protein
MLRNDAYWFSRLGVYIERADNTARILDVKYHVLLPERRAGRRPARLFPVVGDPALGLGADRLSLGLSREPEAVAGRRSPDPQRPDAALAGSCYENLVRYLDASPSPMAARARAAQARAIRTRLQNAASTRSSSRRACTNSSRTSSPRTTGWRARSPAVPDVKRIRAGGQFGLRCRDDGRHANSCD